MSKACSTTAPAESTGAKVRRQVTSTLFGLGEAVDPVSAVAYLGVIVCWIFGIGDAAHLSHWELAGIGLAVAGAAHMIRLAAFSAAEAINPDARDGDSALMAATILRELREDLANGAEADSVLDRLTEANIGTGLGDLVADLANERDERVGDDHPLWEAALRLREVDHLIARHR